MTGRLVLVVGPSGAGKDTLIALARTACDGDPTIVFPRRVVTRPASEYEDHDTVSEARFQAALEVGQFALSWSAHGLRYGIPADIERDLHLGRTVVCNVSRTVVAEAKRKYPNTRAILVTAPADVLASRLSGRRRTSDGLQAARLSRSAEVADRFEPGETIHNVGLPEEAAARLVSVIRRDNDAPGGDDEGATILSSSRSGR